MIQTEHMTNAEIRTAGLKILAKELGEDGLIRFLHEYDMGSGDYTKERVDLFKDETVKTLGKRVLDFQQTL
jgi:hypothetical protein